MSTYSLGTSTTSFTSAQNAMNPGLNENQRSVYQQIVNGIRITAPIPATYYTAQFDTDGNKLVSFATKVALQHRMRGEYEKNLKKIVAGARSKANVFACTMVRKGHCATHITGAHAQSAQDASKVRNIIRGAHGVDTWRKYAGNPNHTGRTAQAHAHSRTNAAHANVADIFSNVPISKTVIKTLAKEHGMSEKKYTQMVMQNHLLRKQGGGNNWNTGSNRRTRSGSGTPMRRQQPVGSVSSNLREKIVRGVPKNNSRTRVNSWIAGSKPYKGTSNQSMRAASTVVGSTGRPGSNRNGSLKATSTSTRGSKFQAKDIKLLSKNQKDKVASMIRERMQKGETPLRQQFAQKPSTSANSGNTRRRAQNALEQRLGGLTKAQAADLLRRVQENKNKNKKNKP